MIFTPEALAGRTILVTGASSGLGRALAIMAAACGARIVAAGRDEARLAATLAALAPGDHRALAIEMQDADATADAMSQVATQLGGLDGVFHSAGVELILPMRLSKQRHVDEVFGAAVNGAFGLARAAAKADVMRPGASIVMMSSISASRGRGGMGIYSAAKAAIEGLTRSLAGELAPRAIRVNAIASGGVKTEMHDRSVRRMSEVAVGEYEASHPLGLGEPEDVASIGVFLLSPAARWVTGAVWTADGGYLAN